MFAARAQNVEQWILPALAEGKIVVSDRFTDSSLGYQGAARGLGWDTVLEVDRIACQGLVPISPSASMSIPKPVWRAPWAREGADPAR